MIKNKRHWVEGHLRKAPESSKKHHLRKVNKLKRKWVEGHYHKSGIWVNGYYAKRDLKDLGKRNWFFKKKKNKKNGVEENDKK